MFVIMRECYDEGYMFWAYDYWRPVTGGSSWLKYAETWPEDELDEAEARAKELGRGAFVSWEEIDFKGV